MFDLSTEERGQAYIVESILAVALLSAVLLTATSTIGTPQPAIEPEDKKLQTEIESDIASSLDSAKRNGELKSLILNWNASDRRYDDYDTLQNSKGYYLESPNGTLGKKLGHITSKHSDRDAEIAIEITPAEVDGGVSGELPNTDPESVAILSGTNATKTLVAEEEYITVYAGDTLQSPPTAYSQQSAPSMWDGARTVKEAYVYEQNLVDNTSNDVSEMYFPLEPKTSSVSSLDPEDTWNTYRITVKVWFQSG